MSSSQNSDFVDPFAKNTPSKQPASHRPSLTPKTRYDENYAYVLAEALLSRAKWTVIGFTLLGCGVGFLVGGGGGAMIWIGTYRSPEAVVIGGIIGIVVGFFIGLGIGRTRAFWLRLEAHRNLWMIQVERHLRSINIQTRS